MLSPTPAETAELASRRPFLALLLSASIPSARSLRGKNFADIVEDLGKALPEDTTPRFPFHGIEKALGERWTAWLVAAVEYLIVTAALENTAYRKYYRTI